MNAPTSMKRFRVEEDSLQHRFLASRSSIRFYGGGFANGKTSGACILALQIAKDYPGSNGLIARSTYPKLNDTIRREFLKWCPKHWIKSFPMSANASNTCTFTNGTEVNFRYIAQQGKGKGESTSNLLSATYDWVIVDQIEDPEIGEKDFLDLLGRLRGQTRYVGDDDTMPESGPRWLISTLNPTRNWMYRKVIRPYHLWQRDGRYHEGLLCETDEESNPILDAEGRATPIMELYEGSTYENRANLPKDFIKKLEATYRGQMRERFLLGKWAAYEGLVYWMHDATVHSIPKDWLAQYIRRLQTMGYNLRWIEGFDYGMAVASCYLLAAVDPFHNVIVVDGFHEPELNIEQMSSRIQKCRRDWDVELNTLPFADPSIFKRSAKDRNTVGKSIAALFQEEGVPMQRGNNNVLNGITKVQGFLNSHSGHRHPQTTEYEAPFLYYAEELEFLADEFGEYRWSRDPLNEVEDKPVGKNDHAMDTLKYMLSQEPEAGSMHEPVLPPMVMLSRWHEYDEPTRQRTHRYG